MQTVRRTIQRSATAVIAGFAILVVAAVTAGWILVRTQDVTELVAHTFEVEAALADLRSLSERIETARRGYLIEPDSRFLATFEETAAELPRQLERISALVSDNPSQIGRLAELKRLNAEHLRLLRDSISDRSGGGSGVSAATILDEEDVSIVSRIRELSREMTGEERTLLAERETAQRRGVIASYIILVVAFVLLIAVAAGTIAATRRNMRELALSRDQLRLLNTDLESAVAVRTSELQRANDEIQRFAYIVSHDLRSPLVNVMGFTSELEAATRPLSEMIDRAEEEAPDIVTEEARLAVREDLPESIGFIRSSTQKMDRLINAILRLSREGRRVLTPEPVDMNEIVRQIADTMQHRVDEMGAEIRVEPLPTLVTDRLAIEQIVSNLVENAVKYLKPGRAGVVTVRGTAQRDRAIIEIEDNGRGIDPKDHERIFDLFRRSGAQDQPGEGIGLAHVRALAYRLGGVISCESTLDQGATFRISMPLEIKSA
ncbi:CHASE3 domain-containing protein [Aurantimonas sp. VKM B-3413]|uniref:sensor histidine kinase n=1 Tax=Aurantimonas sp. VKM B-3413 TaxID=2779401 RepID=UPI001E43A224|nr:sensor histidine kinase [Aurantimonas sp. VKM B-3413]MCB8838845.1 CHASE3 domain-containing protein [Aurantimonas sp. VKM B-3413]